MTVKLASIPATYEQVAFAIERLRVLDAERYWTLDPAYPSHSYWAVMDTETARTTGYYATADASAQKFPDGQGDLISYGRGTVVVNPVTVEPGTGMLGHIVQAIDGPVWGEAFDLQPFTAALEEAGFSVAARVPFDPDDAPPLWKPEYGTPDLVLWHHPG